MAKDKDKAKDKAKEKDKDKKEKKAQKKHATGKIDRRQWWERIGIPAKSVKDRKFRKLFPFDPHHVQVNDQNMHFIDEGEGEPVVMVHGNPTWSFFYRQLVETLRLQHRCLAVDHVGCGFSDKPRKYTYNLETHINNFERWLDIVLPPADWNGGKFDLIVHDWGGPIGLGYAVRHPERVNRIVVMNSSVFTEGDMPRRIKLCRVPVLGAFLVRGLNLFASMATTMTTNTKLSAAVRKAYVMPYNSWGNRVAVHRFIQDIPLKKGTPTYKLFQDIEDKIQDALEDKPLLIQWGMDDWCFTPFFLDLWREYFPKAEVDEYDAGHYLLEDMGEEIAERIRVFLEQNQYAPPGDSHLDPLYDSLDEVEGSYV